MPTSGSFVRGNYSGRFTGVFGVHDRLTDASGYFPFVAVHDRLMDVSIGPTVTASIAITKRGSFGFLQGIAFNASQTNIGNDSLTGKHMQIGIAKNTTDGTPSAPCLELDFPGAWRFRWTIQGGTRTISVSAKQNSTGSKFRPSINIKANSYIGINYDVSGSAADGNGWVTIGPISVTPTGTGSVWVELKNNNTYYPMSGYAGNIVSTPALFDNIVTT